MTLGLITTHKPRVSGFVPQKSFITIYTVILAINASHIIWFSFKPALETDQYSPWRITLDSLLPKSPFPDRTRRYPWKTSCWQRRPLRSSLELWNRSEYFLRSILNSNENLKNTVIKPMFSYFICTLTECRYHASICQTHTRIMEFPAKIWVCTHLVHWNKNLSWLECFECLNYK